MRHQRNPVTCRLRSIAAAQRILMTDGSCETDPLSSRKKTAEEQKNFGGWVSDKNGIMKNILQPRFGNDSLEKLLLCKRSSTTLTQRWTRRCTDTDSPIESSAALWSLTPHSHKALRFGVIGVSGCTLHSSSLFWDTVSSSTLRWKHEAVSQSGSGGAMEW